MKKTSLFFVFSIIISLTACSDAETQEPGVADTQSQESTSASSVNMDDFKTDTCKYLSEEEIRDIFDIESDLDIRLSGALPCYYTWGIPDPQNPNGPSISMAAGIVYTVAMAESAGKAHDAFVSSTQNVSEEDMTEMADRTAGNVLEDQDLSESQEEIVTDFAVDAFGKELVYSAVGGVGDEAAWESSHGELTVRSGSVVFKVTASRGVWDPTKGTYGGLVDEKLEDKAMEVAQAVIAN